MNENAIGVFDSGIGGLTVVKELVKLMPEENLVYFGDTARVPYGSHSAETVKLFARQDMEFLLSMNVKAVLVACGTASSTSLDMLREMTDIPVVGVISAAAAKAASSSKNKKIAVLATNATISSHAYKKAIEKVDPSCTVYEKACPLFVPLIENGYADNDNPVSRQIALDYLGELAKTDIDTVILGCTHYPVFKRVIGSIFEDAAIIEAGKEAALEMASILRSSDMCAAPGNIPKREYFVSETTESFNAVSELFLGENIGESIKIHRFM